METASISPLRKAVFLDRDGTIIEDRGYLGNCNDIEVYPFVWESLRQLQKGYLLFIVSNQSGIGKGIVTKEQVETVNTCLLNLLKAEGIAIQQLYYCPHTNEDKCQCKKPSPYFLECAAAEFGLDLSASWMIGDHPSDVYCASNAGVQGIYILTGHGTKHLNELENQFPVKDNLAEAARYILHKSKP